VLVLRSGIQREDNYDAGKGVARAEPSRVTLLRYGDG
jgi:hypothetical protein